MMNMVLLGLSKILPYTIKLVRLNIALMIGNMKKVFIIIGVILCVVAYPFRSMLVEVMTATKAPVEDVREGDVIFQTSLSQQSPLIKMGTRSTITHCGVVVMKDGKPYVLETQKTLVLTPLEKFIARGKDGKYWHKRPKMDNIIFYINIIFFFFYFCSFYSGVFINISGNVFHYQSFQILFVRNIF